MSKPMKTYKQSVTNCIYFDPVERIQIGFDEHQWIFVRGKHNTYHQTLQSLVDKYVGDETRQWPFMTHDELEIASNTLIKRFLKVAHDMDSFRKNFIKEQNIKRGEVLKKRLGRK